MDRFSNTYPSEQPPVDVPERLIVEAASKEKKPTRRKKAASDGK